MAEDTHYEFAATDTQEILADRQRGWEGFVQFATWGIGVTVLILLALLVFVA
ncbi:MAG: preprotein translocase subunit SecE [Acetobacteraceae bacterium]|nr:MAG: preprotein translocase subunit SecE [Acetobacteraceae bacterium]